MLSNSFNHAFEDLFQYRDYYGTLWKHKSYQLIVQMSWGLIVESNSPLGTNLQVILGHEI